jgi:glycerol-3-phosphate dehydrogenase
LHYNAIEMKSRAKALRSIEAKSFDVCVIGGGATGSGCALDAQLRGLKTVQLEAGDFASATSSTSTKMVHGGVRYLEQAIRNVDPAEYQVVRRALRERVYMLRNAPFLTGMLEFLTPCFRWRDAAYFQIGLKIYDWIAGHAGIAPSRFVPRDEALRRMPELNQDHLVGAVAYTDGQFDDARYNLALVSTFTDAGGEALNYARVMGFEESADGKLQAAQVEVLGEPGGDGQAVPRHLMVRARAFVNATGPFTDSIRQMAAPGIAPRMRVSKGVHILLPLEVFSGRDAMLIPKTDDGRVLFAIPYQGRVLVGTTDDEIGVGDELYLVQEEVDYLLRHLNRYLASPVSRDQVVSGTAGARPLANSREGAQTKKLLRDHEVELDTGSGLISILGGKWTTYRAMAEDTIDAAQKYLNVAAGPCSTKHHALSGSSGYTPEYWRELAGRFGISERTARHLAAKYGARAVDVLALARENAELRTPLVEGLGPMRAEVVYGARFEMAISIEDILARRIGLEVYGWSEAIHAAPIVADLLARELGWSEGANRYAVSGYVAGIRNRMRRAGLFPSDT